MNEKIFGPTKCGLILDEIITKHLKPLDRYKIRRCFNNWMDHKNNLAKIKNKDERIFYYQCIIVYLKKTVFEDLQIKRYINPNDFDQYTVEIRKRLFYCIKRELLKTINEKEKIN